MGGEIVPEPVCVALEHASPHWRGQLSIVSFGYIACKKAGAGDRVGEKTYRTGGLTGPSAVDVDQSKIVRNKRAPIHA